MARLDKVSKIIPQFSKVAMVGDEVMMGLEGDPKFPYNPANRPLATVSHITQGQNGTELTLRKSDGSSLTVNEYTMSPTDVWEFTDKAFSNVLERERAKQTRSEQSLYRGSTDDISTLRAEVSTLRQELAQEKRTTKDFHTTFLASLYELSGDVCKMDTSGKHAQFCRTFSTEYDKMKARAEGALYRGVAEEASGDESDASTSGDDAVDQSDFF